MKRVRLLVAVITVLAAIGTLCVGIVSCFTVLRFHWGDKPDVILQRSVDCADLIDIVAGGKTSLVHNTKDLVESISHATSVSDITFDVKAGQIIAVSQKVFACEAAYIDSCPKCGQRGLGSRSSSSVCAFCRKNARAWRVPALLSVTDAGEVSRFHRLQIIHLNLFGLGFMGLLFSCVIYFWGAGRRKLISNRRLRNNQCVNCGYSLIGSVSENCPECGSKNKLHCVHEFRCQLSHVSMKRLSEVNKHFA